MVMLPCYLMMRQIQAITAHPSFESPAADYDIAASSYFTPHLIIPDPDCALQCTSASAHLGGGWQSLVAPHCS